VGQFVNGAALEPQTGNSRLNLFLRFSSLILLYEIFTTFFINIFNIHSNSNNFVIFMLWDGLQWQHKTAISFRLRLWNQPGIVLIVIMWQAIGKPNDRCDKSICICDHHGA